MLKLVVQFNSLRCVPNGCHTRPFIYTVTAQMSHPGLNYKLGLCPTLFSVRGKENVMSLKISALNTSAKLIKKKTL